MSAPTARRLLSTRPPELVVYDEHAACPYLPARVSRLPLRLPVRPLTRDELDERLVAGDRRQGLLLYRTACPECQACEPIRVDVRMFVPSATQRRVFRRGEERFDVQLGPLEPTLEKVALYNRHKQGRGLNSGDPPIDLEGYRAFLGESCCESFEIRYRIEGKLVAVAIVDRGATSLSAVYCYFDPEHEHLSPGVYSILKQVDLCKKWGLRHLYLGLYIAEASSMCYKARYRPHQRLLTGDWRFIDR